MRPVNRLLLAALSLAAAAAPLAAQIDTTKSKPDSVNSSPAAPHDTVPTPPPAPAPALPFTFSGVIFANFNYGGAKGSRTQDRFDLQRAYLTFQAPAGDRTSIRVTADVFQQTSTTNNASAYYAGWTVRAKYAYVQYNWLNGLGDELKSNVRLGMLHTPVIDHEEQFWIRGLSQTAVEQAGFFS